MAEGIQKPDRSSYTALDFRAFRDAEALEITPKFQRREVWKTPAKAYFIDSLIRGLPVPPIYLRVSQSADRKRTVREVIDGQQRIKALLGFLEDEFPLARSTGAPYAGKYYSELRDKEQEMVSGYPLICESLYGLSDAQVLEIFARLNTYSVSLNQQELRNGTYFGAFKQSAYALALEHIEFWRRNRIFTETAIARMLEVELTSELMVMELDGLQDKKTSLNRFYEEHDEEFRERSKVERRLRATLDVIGESLGDSLPQSNFRKSALFYSLFGAVYHHVHGLPGVRLGTQRKALSRDDRRGLREAAERLSDVLDRARAEEPVPRKYLSFVVASSATSRQVV